MKINPFFKIVTALEGAWIDRRARIFRFAVTQITIRQPDQPCHVSQDAAGRLKVLFDAPQRAVTPGQYVVFYEVNAVSAALCGLL